MIFFFFFFALFRLERSSLPSCVGLQAGVAEAVGGLFPERHGERRVSQIETLGSHGHIYRDASGALDVTLLLLSLSVCLSVCKSVRLLLFTTCGKRPRSPPPFFFYYLLSHSPPFSPPSASNCLSLPYSSIVSLYLAPLAASALEDEIVMLIVIFCGGDKEGESHTQEIAFGSYGGSAAGYGKHPLLWLHSNSNYTEDSHMDGSPKLISCMMILRSS